MIHTAVAVACMAAVAVLLWPRRAEVEAEAARAVVDAAIDSHEVPVPWWNRDIAWSAMLSRSRPAGIPVGFLDGLAAALGAGLTPVDALRAATRDLDEVDPGSPDVRWLRPVLDSSQSGRPIGSVWRSIARRTGDPDLASLGRAWMISERLGAPLAEAVTAAAAMSRSRAAFAGALASATAGAKATCTLLTVLPLGGIGLALLLGIHPLTLYAHPLALTSLSTGLALLLLGRWWIGRMIRAVTALA
ncbi:MAG: type II secretion system F family protein [Ornithinimicrobium sp.]